MSYKKRASQPETLDIRTLARQSLDQVAIILMALAGVGIAIYLTTVHYAKVPLICSTTGLIDCAGVTTSQYSVVPGTTIPITIPGIGWFLVSMGIAVAFLACRRRGEQPPERLRQAQLVWSALGLLSIFYLIYAEIVKLHRICEWCTGVHALILATFLVVLYRWQTPAVPDEEVEVAPAPTRVAKPVVATSAALPPRRTTPTQQSATTTMAPRSGSVAVAKKPYPTTKRSTKKARAKAKVRARVH